MKIINANSRDMIKYTLVFLMYFICMVLKQNPYILTQKGIKYNHSKYVFEYKPSEAAADIAGDEPLGDVFAVGIGEDERDFFAAGLSVSPDFLFWKCKSIK